MMQIKCLILTHSIARFEGAKQKSVWNTVHLRRTNGSSIIMNASAFTRKLRLKHSTVLCPHNQLQEFYNPNQVISLYL